VQQLLACREDFRDPYNRAYEQALPSPQESREQVLADNLGQIEINKGHGVITVRRLSELFGPVLRTNSFDVDQKKGNDRWTRAVLRTTDQFIAVTRGHNYAGLLPRDEAVNDIIRTLIDTVSGRATATRKTRS
jgi:hypothetical protein